MRVMRRVIVVVMRLLPPPPPLGLPLPDAGSVDSVGPVDSAATAVETSV